MTMGRESYGEVALAFLLGAIVGTAGALLYAPAAGAETRRRIAEATGRLRDSSEEKLEQTRDYLAGKLDQGTSFPQNRRDAVDAAVSAGQAAYRSVKEAH